MKDIKEYINNNSSIVYFLCLLIGLLLITIFYEGGIINNNLKNLLFGWLIYGYIIINLFFNVKNVEKFFIKYMTIILFMSLLFISYYQIEFNINNNQLFIIIGGVFGFWYGYKKYERDKEISILEKYGKKYDEINIIKNKQIRFKKILNLCEEEFYLKQQGYISNNLWEKIEHKIEKNLSSILLEIIKLKSEKKQQEMIGIFADDDIMCHKKGYGYYIINKLKEIQLDAEKISKGKVDYFLYKDKKTKTNYEKVAILIPLIIKHTKEWININKKHFNN